MADIITTNTFNTLRPALEVSGYAEMAREITCAPQTTGGNLRIR